MLFQFSLKLSVAKRKAMVLRHVANLVASPLGGRVTQDATNVTPWHCNICLI